MAKKKLLKPLEDPPVAASSSGDDKVDSSSGEDVQESQISVSSAEEEEPKTPTTKTLKTPSTPLAKPAAAASSETGSDSDSEPEPEPEEKTISKMKESDGSTAVKSGKKRASEATTSKGHAKRAKKVSGDDEKKHGEDNKKPLFQRLWTEEDEISLLQGMIDFEAEKGVSPYQNMNEFFDLGKKDISFDVSKVQFTDKIRSLRRKYMGDDKKGKKPSSFSKPHDMKCLTLANCIWGSDGMALDSVVKSPVGSNKVDKKKKKKKLESEVGDDVMVLESDVVKGNDKVKKVESSKTDGEKVLGGDSESSNWFHKSFLVRFLVVSLGADEYSVKQKWSKVPMETKKRIEEKLKLVEAEEWGLVLKKTDIVKEVATVINEAI